LRDGCVPSTQHAGAFDYFLLGIGNDDLQIKIVQMPPADFLQTFEAAPNHVKRAV
jgi:hypothetical protein